MINHYIPSSLQEAVQLLSEHDCYIMAGGTDLMVHRYRRSGLLPNFDKDILYVANIEELNYIKQDENGDFHIGATTKLVDILNHELTPTLMKDIIRELASPNIRNMATMAGNLANASPAGDSIVGLYLLDAQVVLASIHGERTMPAQEFVFGIRKISRKKDELIKEIIIPHYDFKTYWKKVGSRASESISKITFAGGYKVIDGIVKEFRIAYGSVSITVVRKQELEEKYKNLKIEDFKAKIPAIIEDFIEFVKPIDDQRSSKIYRIKVARNITRHFLESIEQEGL